VERASFIEEKPHLSARCAIRQNSLFFSNIRPVLRASEDQEAAKESYNRNLLIESSIYASSYTVGRYLCERKDPLCV